VKNVCIFFLALSISVIQTGCASCASKNDELRKNNDRGVSFWEDEFDGEELDTAKWRVEEGTGGIYGLNDWGNNEAQYYKKENVSVKNGVLTIRVKKERAGNKKYTSSRISTNGKFAIAAPGRVEARIKMPEGKGMWPAFWMLGEGFPKANPWPRCGEIDIAEMRGGIDDMTVLGTAHYGAHWRRDKYAMSGHREHDRILARDWHIYGVEWDQTGIRWYFDGEEFHSADYSDIFEEDSPVKNTFGTDKPFFIILNLAVGGNFIQWELPPDEVFDDPSNETCTMQVDWVRVWRN
jgi:beta-glucanase (GH16 family)